MLLYYSLMFSIKNILKNKKNCIDKWMFNVIICLVLIILMCYVNILMYCIIWLYTL